MGLPSFITPIMGKSVLDPDAQAFLTAAAITNSTQVSAINTLVIALKNAGIWTKCNAIYPFVGGTATTHKYNLKNPLDTNAAFRLFFGGGGTHSANGYLGNGTNAYADTFLVPSVTLAIGSAHLSYYSRTSISLATNEDKVEMGSAGGGGSVPWLVLSAYQSLASRYLTGTSAAASVVPANTLGMFLGTQRSITDVSLYRNGASIVSPVLTITAIQTNRIFINCRNANGSAINFSTKQCAFASIGSGLTGTETSDFYTIVQAYQTSLSRNV